MKCNSTYAPQSFFLHVLHNAWSDRLPYEALKETKTLDTSLQPLCSLGAAHTQTAKSCRFNKHQREDLGTVTGNADPLCCLWRKKGNTLQNIKGHQPRQVTGVLEQGQLAFSWLQGGVIQWPLIWAWVCLMGHRPDRLLLYTSFVLVRWTDKLNPNL